MMQSSGNMKSLSLSKSSRYSPWLPSWHHSGGGTCDVLPKGSAFERIIPEHSPSTLCNLRLPLVIWTPYFWIKAGRHPDSRWLNLWSSTFVTGFTSKPPRNVKSNPQHHSFLTRPYSLMCDDSSLFEAIFGNAISLSIGYIISRAWVIHLRCPLSQWEASDAHMLRFKIRSDSQMSHVA